MQRSELRKLTEADRARVLAYIAAEPEVNLFIFGDVECFGLEGDTVELFAREGPEGDDWDFLLVRYVESYLLYGKSPGYDARSAAGFLAEKGFNIVSGKSELVEKLLPFFPERRGQQTYMARLDAVRSLPAAPEGFAFRRLAPKDAPTAVELYLQVEEFRPHYAGREEKAVSELRLNLSKGGRCWGAFLGGRLVATASSSGENSVSAMVTGVATLPEFRRRGLAGSLVGRLANELLGEGRRFLCLFYDNPLAGRIYRKIGFREVGRYMMMEKTL